MTADAELAGSAAEPEIEPAGAVATLVERAGPTVWAPAARIAVVQALEDGDATVLDHPDGAQYAVVSTRLPRHRVGEYTAVAREAGLPVIVLVHPGGEAVAVDALCNGGRLAIAEGDAEAIRALGTPAEDDDPDRRADALLDAFEASLGRAQATSRAPVALVEPVSGLPASGALQNRLSSIGADSEPALRVVAISVAALGERQRLRLGPDAHAILHRRIASGLKLICHGTGDLFDLGDGNFVLLAPGLDIPHVDQLGRRMAELVEAYMPDGHMPLSVAVGHAGPECSIDAATLRELAGRAELAARQEERSTVLGAGELVKPLASATELEVAMRLAGLAATRRGTDDRDAIAALAGSIAARLGLEGRERMMVRFCAAVAGLGAALTEDAEDQARATSELVGALAGPTVAAALDALGEQWDGSGPKGLAGPAIPVPARVIAVAARVVADGGSTEGIRDGSGREFDPTVVHAALEVSAS